MREWKKMKEKSWARKEMFMKIHTKMKTRTRVLSSKNLQKAFEDKGNKN